MSSWRSLFQRLDSELWWNVAFTILAMVSLLFAVNSVSMRGVFDYVGVDYRAFRCSAEIALSSGFAQVYNLDLQEACQRDLYETYASGPWRADFAIVPMPYLPPFVLLFVPFLLLPPLYSLALWTVLNTALLVLYLWRFLRTLGGRGRAVTILKVAVSLTAFITLLLGQVNVLLLLFMGEFLLAIVRGKGFRGGLWLGGLLLKPQLLILLLPGLLIGRRFKALLGFAVVAVVLAGLSVLLAGIPGMMGLGDFLLHYPDEMAATVPGWMMNWRALAVNLEAAQVPALLSWGLAVVGMVGTAGVALWLWARPAGPTSQALVVTLLGTCAATCAVTWHAHVHVALVLVAPLLFLEARRWLPDYVLNACLAVPGLIFFATTLVVPGVAPSLVGLAMLAINIYLVIRAARMVQRLRWGRASGRGPADDVASGSA